MEARRPRRTQIDTRGLARAALALAAYSRERVRAAGRQIATMARAVADGLRWAARQLGRFTRWVWRCYWTLEDRLLHTGAEVVVFAYAVRQLVLFVLLGAGLAVVAGLVMGKLVGTMAGRITGGLIGLGWLLLLLLAPRLSSVEAAEDEQEAAEQRRLAGIVKSILRALLRLALLGISLALWYGPEKAYTRLRALEWPPWSSSAPAPAKESTGTPLSIDTVGSPSRQPATPKLPETRSRVSRPAPATATRSQAPSKAQPAPGSQRPPTRPAAAGPGPIWERADKLFTSGKCAEALSECEKGLRNFPGDTSLLRLKERILNTRALGYC